MFIIILGGFALLGLFAIVLCFYADEITAKIRAVYTELTVKNSSLTRTQNALRAFGKMAICTVLTILFYKLLIPAIPQIWGTHGEVGASPHMMNLDRQFELLTQFILEIFPIILLLSPLGVSLVIGIVSNFITAVKKTRPNDQLG